MARSSSELLASLALFVFLAQLALHGCVPRETRVVLLPPVPEAAGDTTRGRYGILYAVPRYEDGVRRGIRVGAVVSGSLADRMGLREDDVILELDGIPCDAVPRCRAGAHRLEWALRRRSPFELVLERHGRAVLLRYRYHQTRPVGL